MLSWSPCPGSPLANHYQGLLWLETQPLPNHGTAWHAVRGGTPSSPLQGRRPVPSGVFHVSPSGSSRSCSPELMPRGTPPPYLLSRGPVLFFSSSAAHELCLWCKNISRQPELLVGCRLHMGQPPTPTRRTVSLQTTLAFPGS